MMSCEEFRRKYPGRRALIAFDDADWHQHLDECRACSDWYLARLVEEPGHDPSRYPCVHIAYYSVGVCTEHTDPFECPDIMIVANLDRPRFGLPIRDGGSAFIEIRHCPWCGIELPSDSR